MKDFTRSKKGKIIIFILTLVIGITFFTSIISMASMMKYGMYTQSMQSFIAEQDEVNFDNAARNAIWSISFPNRYSRFNSEISKNIQYKLIDENDNIVAQSSNLQDDFSDWTYESKYYAEKFDEYGNLQIYKLPGFDNTIEYTGYFALNTQFPYKDMIYFERLIINVLYAVQPYIIFVSIISLIAGIFFLYLLLSASGHKPGTDSIYPGFFTRIPLDLIFFLCFCLFGIMLSIASVCPDSISLLIMLSIILCTGTAAGISLLNTIAVRIKLGTLISNNIITWLIKLVLKPFKYSRHILSTCKNFVGRIYSNLNVLYRVILACTGIIFVDILLIMTGDRDFFIAANLFIKFVLSCFIIYIAVCLLDFQKAAKTIASGNTGYKIRTNYRFLPVLNDYARDMNSISDGIATAVNERLKSEHMKTELITNVSHDIKTPLTSIINYAELIKAEPAGSKDINQYSEVLIRQSVKLKRLLEDLVEISKASTGNLECNPIPCDPAIFISQISGEYEDKLKAAGLTPVVRYEDTQMQILADGRRMWRVFDNLMNNICKYAQPGTRVYISLDKIENKAVITFKNTSRDELNISENELMERFVRGDSSRNTEGNGLGLSIADSLVKLQGGIMNIVIDGDLFKVTLTFPTVQ